MEILTKIGMYLIKQRLGQKKKTPVLWSFFECFI